MQIAARRFACSSCLRSRKEFFDKSNAVFQLNIQWHWRSSSAAVSPDSLKRKHGQKKLSKQERRAMVEGFIEKYRASNAGKFPTASCAHKQVGGSYYIIREIVQELEYNHKRAPPEPKKEFKLGKEENIKCLNSTLMGERIISVDDRQTSIKEYASHSAEVAVQTQAHTKKPPHTEEATTSVSLKLEAEEKTFHPPPDEIKIHVKDAKSAAPLQEAQSPERNQISSQEVLRSEELNLGQEEMVELGAPKASSFWCNLKSFSAGIFNIWKK